MGDPEEEVVYMTPEGQEVFENLVDEGLTPNEALDVMIEAEPESDIESSQNEGEGYEPEGDE